MRTRSPEEQAMKEMALDDFIQWMLDHSRYDVDLEQGVIFNARTKHRLKPQPSGPRAPYMQVSMVFSGRVIRQVKVHRVVAIKAWGVESARDHEVGHRNGDTTSNGVRNLWIPASNAEHDAFDNSSRGLVAAPIKTDWAPCARCGDVDGPTRPGCHSPLRTTGRKFGIEGAICERCYHLMQEQERRARRSNS